MSPPISVWLFPLTAGVLCEPIPQNLLLAKGCPSQGRHVQSVDLVAFFKIPEGELDSTSRFVLDEMRKLPPQARVLLQYAIDLRSRLTDRTPPTLARIDSGRMRELHLMLDDPRNLAFHGEPKRIAQILDLLGEVVPIELLV